MSSLPKDFDIKKISDRNYKGDDFQVNPKLVKEPFNNRKFTDLVMALVFLVFLGGMGFMTGYGYVNGNPNELLAPIDTAMNICGFTEAAKDYPYLYIYDVESALTVSPTGGFNLFGTSTCAKSCPSTLATPTDCLNQSACDGVGSTYSAYTTYELLGYCVPNEDSLPASVKDNWQAALDLILNTGGSSLYDVYKSRWIIFGSVFVAILFAMIYIKFMDLCALQVAWVSVILVQLGLIPGGFICWYVRSD